VNTEIQLENVAGTRCRKSQATLNDSEDAVLHWGL